MKTENVVATQTKPSVAAVERPIALSARADAMLARAVSRTAASALRWWMMQREMLADGGYQWSRSTHRTYVGMHTPDTDPVSIHTYALGGAFPR